MRGTRAQDAVGRVDAAVLLRRGGKPDGMKDTFSLAREAAEVEVEVARVVGVGGHRKHGGRRRGGSAAMANAVADPADRLSRRLAAGQGPQRTPPPGGDYQLVDVGDGHS